MTKPKIEMARLNRIAEALKEKQIILQISTKNTLLDDKKTIFIWFDNYKLTQVDKSTSLKMKLFCRQFVSYIMKFNDAYFEVKNTDDRKDVEHFDLESIKSNFDHAIKNGLFKEYITFIHNYLIT